MQSRKNMLMSGIFSIRLEESRRPIVYPVSFFDCFYYSLFVNSTLISYYSHCQNFINPLEMRLANRMPTPPTAYENYFSYYPHSVAYLQYHIYIFRAVCSSIATPTVIAVKSPPFFPEISGTGFAVLTGKDNVVSDNPDTNKK